MLSFLAIGFVFEQIKNEERCIFDFKMCRGFFTCLVRQIGNSVTSSMYIFECKYVRISLNVKISLRQN